MTTAQAIAEDLVEGNLPEEKDITPEVFSALASALIAKGGLKTLDKMPKAQVLSVIDSADSEKLLAFSKEYYDFFCFPEVMPGDDLVTKFLEIFEDIPTLLQSSALKNVLVNLLEEYRFTAIKNSNKSMPLGQIESEISEELHTPLSSST